MHQILSEVFNLGTEAELMTMLNNPAPLDKISTKGGINVNNKMELFESE